MRLDSSADVAVQIDGICGVGAFADDEVNLAVAVPVGHADRGIGADVDGLGTGHDAREGGCRHIRQVCGHTVGGGELAAAKIPADDNVTEQRADNGTQPFLAEPIGAGEGGRLAHVGVDKRAGEDLAAGPFRPKRESPEITPAVGDDQFVLPVAVDVEHTG